MTEAIEITIGGHSFNLRSDNPEQLIQLAGFVDQKLAEVTGGKKDVNLRAALLTALNLAEELHREKSKNTEIMRKIKEKATDVKEHIESVKSKVNNFDLSDD